MASAVLQSKIELGDGLSPKTRLNELTVAESAAATSVTINDQVPLGFRPFINNRMIPSGSYSPVNGAEPDEMMPFALCPRKHVPVKLFDDPPRLLLNITVKLSGLISATWISPSYVCDRLMQTRSRTKEVSMEAGNPDTTQR